MAEKLNKQCIICGKMYSYCPSCHHDKNKPSWYAIFDGENCKNIYDVCTNYRDGIYDKKTAYDKLMKLDITDIKNFADSTKKQIEEIMGYAEIKKEVATKVPEKEVENKQYKNNKK